MLPVIEALTSSTWPSWSATIAMMSSAAFPNVALRNPPTAGPDRCASSSVPRPMMPGEWNQRNGRENEHPGRVGRHRVEHP